MDRFIIGIKKEQSQRFDEKGNRIPVTFVQTSPNYLVNIKTAAKDGYDAVVLGFEENKNIPNPVKGLLKKAGITVSLHHIAEFRFDANTLKVEEVEGKKAMMLGEAKVVVGQEIKPAQLFAVNDVVKATATSKGKGFQGVVKRHHFKGGSKTHGQSDRQRAPGSIGMTTTPGRVFRGKRMAGRMGNDTITLPNCSVVEIKDNGIVIKGLVAGPIGGLVRIRK